MWDFRVKEKDYQPITRFKIVGECFRFPKNSFFICEKSLGNCSMKIESKQAS